MAAVAPNPLFGPNPFKLGLFSVNADGGLAGRMSPKWRLRCYIAHQQDFMTVAKIVGRHFGDIRPANTTVFATLVLREMKVEIEVSAHKSGP